MSEDKQELRSLTDEEKMQIVWGIESEGFDYYFTKYTHKWAEEGTEIQPFAKAFLEASQDLEKKVASWGIEAE